MINMSVSSAKTVFVTIPLLYSLKSRLLMPPTVLLLLRVVLAILGLFLFPHEDENSLLEICKELCWNFDVDFFESVICFW